MRTSRSRRYRLVRTEFIILNGKIEYRGNDGDQERVQGKAGQKAYLNFSDNTGKVE